MRKKLVKLILVFFLLGCGVSKYSANTTAKYKICDPTGVCSEFYYESEKEQKITVKFIKGDDGQIKGFEFSVESGTSDAALAMTAQSAKTWADVFESLKPLIAKAAMVGS